jgi:opacity protein-like surface antigen
MRRDRILVRVLVASLAFALGLSTVYGAGTAGVVVGQQRLDEEAWDPVENQLLVAVETSWGGASWPVQIAVDLARSGSDEQSGGIEREGETLALYLGVRRWFGRARTRPFVGGGAEWVRAEVTASGFGETRGADASGFGYWIGGGVAWRVTRHVQLGLAARFSSADVTLSDFEGDAGGFGLGVLAGWTSAPVSRRR